MKKIKSNKFIVFFLIIIIESLLQFGLTVCVKIYNYGFDSLFVWIEPIKEYYLVNELQWSLKFFYLRLLYFEIIFKCIVFFAVQNKKLSFLFNVLLILLLLVLFSINTGNNYFNILIFFDNSIGSVLHLAISVILVQFLYMIWKRNS